MTEITEYHLTREELEDLVEGRLGAHQRQTLVRHLLGGCEHCRRIAAAFGAFSLGSPISRQIQPQESSDNRERNASLDLVLDRVLKSVDLRRSRVIDEQRKTPQLWNEIKALPLEQCRLLVTNGRRFHTWAFAHLLSERAEEAGFNDPQLAIGLAQLAILAAERVDSSITGTRTVRDLLGHCWAGLGNARRIVGDLEGAEEALEIAREWLSQGTGDPIEESRRLDLMASLRRDRRQFKEALELQVKAAALYRRMGETHLEGRMLVGKAKTLYDMEEPALAATALRRALCLLDPEREPRVLLAAYHNLVHALSELGNLDEALKLLDQARPLYRRVGGALNLLRLRWLEGKIERKRGRYLAACRAFLEVRDAFLARHLGYEAAVVTLDLALTHLETGNNAAVRRLASEAIPVFERLGIQREAFAALLALREAAQRELVTSALLKELYQRATHRPT